MIDLVYLEVRKILNILVTLKVAISCMANDQYNGR